MFLITVVFPVTVGCTTATCLGVVLVFTNDLGTLITGVVGVFSKLSTNELQPVAICFGNDTIPSMKDIHPWARLLDVDSRDEPPAFATCSSEVKTDAMLLLPSSLDVERVEFIVSGRYAMVWPIELYPFVRMLDKERDSCLWREKEFSPLSRSSFVKEIQPYASPSEIFVRKRPDEVIADGTLSGIDASITVPLSVNSLYEFHPTASTSPVVVTPSPIALYPDVSESAREVDSCLWKLKESIPLSSSPLLYLSQLFASSIEKVWEKLAVAMVKSLIGVTISSILI